MARRLGQTQTAHHLTRECRPDFFEQRLRGQGIAFGPDVGNLRIERAVNVVLENKRAAGDGDDDQKNADQKKNY